MKIKLFFTLLILFSTCSYAQVNIIIDDTFGAKNPSKVLAADLDGDGFKDVISLADGVHWYKNVDGQGKFDKPILIEYVDISDLEFDIDAADIDGDNDMDLVYFIKNPTDLNEPILVWSENIDGQGNFSASQTLRVLDNVSRLKVDLLDVDNDGDIDITYSDYTEIGWLENIDGNANFTDHILLTSAINYDGYSFSDLNGDNLMDIVVDYQNALDFYIHNANDTVTLTQNLDTSSTGKYVVTADIDGDNDKDVATILLDGANSQVLWYENTNSLGVFSSRVTITSLPDMVDADIDSLNNIAFEDLDGDSNLDLLFCYQPTDMIGLFWSSNPTNKMTWYKNLGSGNFGAEQIISSSLLGIKSFFATDIDNDANIDVITSSVYDQQVAWFKNEDGQGTFGEQKLISNALFGIRGLDKGDLDRDGDLDVVTVSVDGKLSLFENTDGLGNFEHGQVIIKSVFQTQGIDAINDINVSISDVDGDEDLDIVVWVFEELDFVEGRIHLFTNDGNLNFTESIPIEYEGFRNYIAYKDIDGDYDLDIVGVMGDSYSTIFYHKNNGDGTFEVAQSLGDGFNFVRALDLGDIDGDDDLDLVIGETGGDISWFSNDGLGNFTLSQTITDNGYYINEIAIENVTNDKNRDITFVNNNNSNTLREVGLLKNDNGLGIFNTKEILLSTDDSIDNVVFMDYDNDRDKDILAGRSNNLGVRDLVWYENLGEITGDEFNYGPYITILEDRRPTQLELFDIDDNGTLDIVGSFTDNSVIWLENFSLEWNEIVGSVTFADGVPCDESNLPFQNILVVADSGENEYATFTQIGGVYQLLIEEPGIYTTTPVIPFAGYYTVTPELYVSDLEDLGVTEINHFCAEPNGIFNDLEISIFPITDEPRPGFNTYYRIVYTNVGPQIESGTVAFEYSDELLNFVSASETVTNSSFGELQFEYSNLSPYESRFITINMIVEQPPIANSGDLLDFFATVEGISEDDVTPVNNTHGIKQFLVNSYDPNDIRVMEGESIFIEDADDYLHYIIRFQNTGSASAININVEHELDEKLDWETMRLEDLSHPGRVEIINGSMVNFIFDDIHLPDSNSNESASHGHIAYKIKPKSDVEIGDVISAVADIYFDFNPPIITNTATTEIVEPLGVNEFNAQSIQLFPNPAKDNLEIVSNQIIDRLNVVDINGRKLKAINVSNLDYSMDVSSLAKGVYFMEIYSGNSSSTKKFIKN